MRDEIMSLRLISSHNSPGALITFEGGDGCGKTTHIKFLTELLEELGFDIVLVREPGGTALGEALRSELLAVENEGMSPRAELLIYEACRAQLIDEVISPALSQGKIVLCDRFTDSTIAYQGMGRRIDVDLIRRLNDFATCGITPDVTLVLHCGNREEKKERVARREELDRLELAGESFHTRVIDSFTKFAEIEPERVKLINTQGKHSETAALIFEALAPVIPALESAAQTYAQKLSDYDAAHDHSKDGEGHSGACLCGEGHPSQTCGKTPTAKEADN